MQSPAVILVIDDNPDNLRVAVDMLESDGFVVRTARDGATGIRRAKASNPQLVLLDVQMTGIDGYETCRLLKEDPQTADLPVIFMTALSATEDKVMAFQAGAIDFVTKPFQLDEMRARIRTHLELGRLQQELRNQNARLEQMVEDRTRILAETNASLSRFVPAAFLAALGHDDIRSAELGDHVHGEYTVMFTDMRGFTTLSETLGPEAAFGLQNAYCGRMGPIISAHGGYICEYRGDGLLAVFADATAAIESAVEQQRSLDALNEVRDANEQPPIRAGIGLNTGPLTLGIIGDGKRLDTSVGGDCVNLASRMEGLTKHYGIRVAISDTTKDAASTDAFSLRFVDRVRTKGKVASTKVFEVLDADPAALRHSKEQTRAALSAGQVAADGGDFGTAVKAFADVLQQMPGDALTRIWLERNARFLLDGREEGWVAEPPK